MPSETGTVAATREVWFDGRLVPLERRDIWGLVDNSPIQHIVITPAQRRDGHFPLKTVLITEIKEPEDLKGLPEGDIVLSTAPSLLKAAREQGLRTCIAFFIEGGQQDLEEASRLAAGHDYAVVDFDLPTNIPLELIIARLQKSNTVLLKAERTVEAMEVAFGVLEQGSDGVLLSTANLEEIVRLKNFLARQGAERLELHPFTVREVRHIGMGLRSCVDTTGIMGRDEGMIIGSTSSGGIFVCSETHYLPYMNLRPFRVNAGAVHSYIWRPGNATDYLTDLRAGTPVLCVNTKGETRALSVGRVKTEVRPLLLIQGVANDVELNVIVQDDWHIRVMGADGEPRNATTIQAGDQLLAYVCTPGRHVGIKVDEKIIES
ncbi:3-dehydroquinate synthase II [Heliomicrobium gestii]|uniref:3-dehydroquinate synthase II n=1 Tax=Heliomicrobium gestii TaxID=2699 RepID=UPI002E28DEB3|nr:3-dehydroquinate synthase II [Heliomicrobium gestii]MBM7866193.1 3-dehydroquinate synthase II/3-amino-4-hydroxybenzoic acid synthase [Heliomicrobium gestii]